MATSNLAYDFSSYTAAPAPRRQPELRVVERKRSAKRAMAAAFTPKVFCVFTIVVTLLCLIIYNQLCLNELTGEINEISNQIKILEGENLKMASRLEMTVSLRSVADQAREQLGMNRVDKYKTEYVNLYQDDLIVLAKPEKENNGFTATAKLAVTSLFSGIKEYISGD